MTITKQTKRKLKKKKQANSCWFESQLRKNHTAPQQQHRTTARSKNTDQLSFIVKFGVKSEKDCNLSREKFILTTRCCWALERNRKRSIKCWRSNSEAARECLSRMTECTTENGPNGILHWKRSIALLWRSPITNTHPICQSLIRLSNPLHIDGTNTIAENGQKKIILKWFTPAVKIFRYRLLWNDRTSPEYHNWIIFKLSFFRSSQSKQQTVNYGSLTIAIEINLFSNWTIEQSMGRRMETPWKLVKH